MAAPPALPDFGVVARAHADLSLELSRCENIPALQEGNLVLQELRQMRNQMRDIQEEIRQTRNFMAAR